jgi:lipid II:glycine glycyltransferase (peptidoglycan interpeptide bridge formation enzyme)
MGLQVVRYGLFDGDQLKVAFQITFHKIPIINKYVGYLPKGPAPDDNLAKALKQIGQENNCAFIKLEPSVEIGNWKLEIGNSFKSSPKPLFSKHNFIIDLTKSEDELLKAMHPKTRYNIRVAQKHNVKVEERTDNQALEIYLKLYFATTKRQGFAGHNEHYHRTVWEVLKDAGMARLLIATYNNNPLFNFKDTIYYTYGGSSVEHKEVMSNNLVCWETIKLGKKLGLKTFDMWGALGPDPNPKDPWIGFHNFKKGYGGHLVEYIGTYDFVINWPIYYLFTFVDRLLPLKIFLLKLLRH